eukprot:SAG22_NODE_3263_length_1822_cov_2.274521_3_plen_71_part_00
MWYLDRVAKICADQPGGVDPKTSHGSYFWQTWETYHDHDPFSTLVRDTMRRTPARRRHHVCDLAAFLFHA